MLKAPFGHCKREDESQESSTHQCLSQFNCGAAAFWLRASGSHIEMSRDAMRQFFCDLQKVAVQRSWEGQCEIKRLQLDFDQTTQMFRLRGSFELSSIKGGFPLFFVEVVGIMGSISTTG